MSSHLRRKVGSAIGIGLMSGVLVWGGYSFSASQASSAPTATPAAAAITTPANGFTDVARQVTPAVVNITTVMTERVSDGSPLPDELRDRMEEFFGKPFDPRRRGPQPPGEHRGPRRGQGSGVIISADGYVLTNNHVIDKAHEVSVTLPDKREFKGKIIGADPKSDLAVVKINASSLSAIPWGDASQLQVGAYVLASAIPSG